MGLSEWSDGVLLALFVAERQEAAFEMLFARHLSLVANTCRRILRDGPDCDDAIQATFLTLAHRADSLTSRSSVAGWLHQTALNISRRARQAARVRGTHETSAINLQAGADSGLVQRLEPLLDAELGALPEKYRSAIVLHHFQGHTIEEGARRMACSAGTFASWLSRGRDLLRLRLSRGGVTLSVVAFADAVNVLQVKATFSTELTAALVNAASRIVAGQTYGEALPRAYALTQGVLKQMYYRRLQSVVGVASIVLAILAGTSCFILRAQEGSQTGDVGALIKQLGSEDQEVRSSAAEKLKALGAAAAPQLKLARKSSDPEVASRAGALVTALAAADTLQRMRQGLQKLVACSGEFVQAYPNGSRVTGKFKCDGAAKYSIQAEHRNPGCITYTCSDGAFVWIDCAGSEFPKSAQRYSLQLATRLDKLAGQTGLNHPLQQLDQIAADYEPVNLIEELSDEKESYRLELSRRPEVFEQRKKEAAEIGGQTTLMIDGYKPMQHARIWMDKKSLLPLKIQILDGGDSVLWTSRVTELRPAGKFPPEEFVYTPPAGITVLDQDASLKGGRAIFLKGRGPDYSEPRRK